MAHLTKKQRLIAFGIGFVLLASLSAGIIWKFYFLSVEEEPLLPGEKISINSAPSIEEKLENTLYKKIDFINKLIADFQLNSHIGKDLYYRSSDSYMIISPSSLLQLDIKELSEVRISIEQNGVFIREKDGTYLTREEYDQKKLEEQNAQKL